MAESRALPQLGTLADKASQLLPPWVRTSCKADAGRTFRALSMATDAPISSGGAQQGRAHRDDAKRGRASPKGAVEPNNDKRQKAKERQKFLWHTNIYRHALELCWLTKSCGEEKSRPTGRRRRSRETETSRRRRKRAEPRICAISLTILDGATPPSFLLPHTISLDFMTFRLGLKDGWKMEDFS